MLMRCTVPVRSSWISRWAYYWLTVTIRAEWERIWIDDQEVAIVRDRFLNGRYVRIKFLCPGCRILHARGRTFVCNRLVSLRRRPRPRNFRARRILPG